ncbi:NAD-glutamate dehydrogenase domain-containing protein [Magnetospirillum sp. 15-1]|uniref:NAD-glutamate dehydrogenase domain-containing protein n=1 Tax=Magnetospirillum sp. 15-1 TaxID=1979370 RepID=UPI002413C106|nr:NAD-glutamate dehydrogenase domain-containing protein [Magnetospirillum sp. 15-1]
MEISAYLDRRIADLSDTLAKAGAERLIRAYASGIPLADLAEADPELVYGAALGLFAFMRERQPGVPSIRVFDPDLDRHGWVSSHSVVEIVNDDMPFLVDSVAMELARRGIKVHLLVHPVVRVDRDGAGMLRQVTANGWRAPCRNRSCMWRSTVSRWKSRSSWPPRWPISWGR